MKNFIQTICGLTPMQILVWTVCVALLLLLLVVLRKELVEMFREIWNLVVTADPTTKPVGEHQL